MIKETLYTPQEVQGIMKKKNTRTIYRYIKSGKLKAIRIQNRFYIEEKVLREFLNLSEDQERR